MDMYWGEISFFIICNCTDNCQSIECSSVYCSSCDRQGHSCLQVTLPTSAVNGLLWPNTYLSSLTSKQGPLSYRIENLSLMRQELKLSKQDYWDVLFILAIGLKHYIVLCVKVIALPCYTLLLQG